MRASCVLVSPSTLPVASSSNSDSQQTSADITNPSLPRRPVRVSNHCALPSASISATASYLRSESSSVAVPFQYPAIAAPAGSGGGVGGGSGGGSGGGVGGGEGGGTGGEGGGSLTGGLAGSLTLPRPFEHAESTATAIAASQRR